MDYQSALFLYATAVCWILFVSLFVVDLIITGEPFFKRSVDDFIAKFVRLFLSLALASTVVWILLTFL